MNEQTWIDQAIGPRVVGGTYRCGYWGDTYTVEEIKVPDERSGWAMRVRWSDGRATIHCTAWDAERDSVVTMATVPGTCIVCGTQVKSNIEHCSQHWSERTERYPIQRTNLNLVPERAPAGMLAVRVGSDPWTIVPLDNE